MKVNLLVVQKNLGHIWHAPQFITTPVYFTITSITKDIAAPITDNVLVKGWNFRTDDVSFAIPY